MRNSLLCYILIGFTKVPCLLYATDAASEHVAYIYEAQPLRCALDVVQSIHGVTINYVEPAYYSDPSRSRPTAKGRDYLIVNEKEFTFKLDAGLNVPDSIDSILQDYRKIEPGVSYEIVTNSVGMVYTVLPTAWPGMDPADKCSPLKIDIPLVPQDENLTSQWLDGVLLAMADESPYEDVIAVYPNLSARPNENTQHKAPQAGPCIPAYEAITRYAMQKKLSWSLYRCPGVWKGKRVSWVQFSSKGAAKDCLDRHIFSWNPRPLDFSIRALERDFSIPVGYEGPDLSKRGIYHGLDGSKAPIGGNIETHYTSTQSVVSVLQKMLTSVSIANTRFALFAGDYGLYVSPSGTYTDGIDERQWSPVEAISSKLVTMTIQDTDFTKAISDLIAYVNESYGISLGCDLSKVPGGKYSFSYKANGEPLGVVLNRCAALQKNPLSWRILYDTDKEGYVLSFHPVGALETDRDKNSHSPGAEEQDQSR